ncbi:MAG: ethanolamine ammonia-lyase subunit EutC, partial [Roseomonas sp.]|nr:ethanolamine ammonia-lyase subunit EutC [Roseomonas sp.]
MNTPSKWHDLRRFTDARVALGRVGNALPTAAHLDFQEAHARARDAVWSKLDIAQLEAALAPLGLPIQ